MFVVSMNILSKFTSITGGRWIAAVNGAARLTPLTREAVCSPYYDDGSI